MLLHSHLQPYFTVAEAMQRLAVAGRLAHAAMAAWSGRGASQQHAAQRVYREVLGFTVLSQTPAVRTATVTALVESLAASATD